MRAMVTPQFGGADLFEERDVERPRPGAGKVLVRVVAAGAHSRGRGGRRHPESPELEKAKKVEGAREGRKHRDKARVSSPLQPAHVSCSCACRKTGRCSQDSAKAR